MLQEESRRRRRVPAPVAVAAAVAAGRRAWEDPAERAAARAAIDAVAGPVRERDLLARQHLVEHAVREELIWRPWQFAGFAGRGHIERAPTAGRGVIASFVHSGPFPGLSASLTLAAGRVHTVAGTWLWAPTEDEPMERRRLRWLANLQEAGVSLVGSAGTYATLAGLLRAGGLVVLGFDTPGTHPTRFLGRRVALASGTARLAAETGALVLPVWRARVRWRPFTVAAAPLDPRAHRGWRELQDALAAVHSRWILARPAALENPCRPGWWGAA
jgi:lauroyl/myristoyl acyltransferase